ncbi:MAG: ABC transporter substrate-binding protein [Candidatus Rokubacteria bacterium]|nr:ABC transporter substrate-binding protein [Candidatus Rokubacteria bacterium]
MRAGWRLLPIALAVLAAGVPAPARAEAPLRQLEGAVTRVLQVLDDQALRAEARTGERRAEIRRIAGEIFDFAEITKRALGPHWPARTRAERAEIVGLMTELLERSYMSKIELYGGERIAFTGETVDGDLATVRTRIITRQGTEIPVDYRMLRQGDHWSAYDVTIEGVSLVANYRSQFAKVIQTGSYAELVRRLRAKLGEADPAEPTLKRTSQK